ncbi:hypothetical protein [Natroniella sp. ANB-PHB2]|uniref:hypothetical protein n=1 Tax=Natroniella sp. ANB-PHB2 TaxID=3384444 RepID=UPI0038D3BE44
MPSQHSITYLTLSPHLSLWKSFWLSSKSNNYGPGGYKFKDFMIAGAPLQLLLAIGIPLFIYLFWGI